MRILFIHQNFPGQYRHIIKALSKQNNHQIIALGINTPEEQIPKNVQYFRYSPKQGNTKGIHHLVMETETKVIRGEACANAALKLKEQGFKPHIVCAHPGWGEALFLKDVWPDVPILSYQEFFYQAIGFDYGFDVELQEEISLKDLAKVRMKNAYNHLMLEASNWNVTPTNFQRSTYPKEWQSKISAIHDGIDTTIASPSPDVKPLCLPNNTKLTKGDPIVTFVNRTIEPYRGCHSFIRSIPTIHDQCPEAQIIIVGKTTGVSYGKPCKQGEYKDQFMKEIDGKYREANVHFVGQLNYDNFLNLLRLSAAHVYLTYPFVLSWSLLEAMSSECSVVGSDTAPVQEVITHEHNGLLVNFFDPVAIGGAVCKLLKDRSLAKQLGKQARKTILKDYSLENCLPRQLALIDLVATGALQA